MESVIILIQLVGAITILLLAWDFLCGLIEEHSFKGALERVKEMLKGLPWGLAGLAIVYGVIWLINLVAGA